MDYQYRVQYMYNQAIYCYHTNDMEDALATARLLKAVVKVKPEVYDIHNRQTIYYSGRG